MKPSKKDEGLERFINSMTPNPLGRKGSIEANYCSWCSKPVGAFKDAISRKEYTISGYCQKCQDKIFGD